MCLYIDDFGEWTHLDDGMRTARKAHRCLECGRIIESGERYRYWTGVWEGQAETNRLCGHCDAVLDVGVALTGCPRSWNGSMLYHPDPEIGFVANIIEDDGHDLPHRDRLRMLRCVAAARRKWRWSDGTLMDLPTVPDVVAPSSGGDAA